MAIHKKKITYNKENLVIFSIPYTRIVKSTLADVVLKPLRDRSDILIVAPFAKDKYFINDFLDKRTKSYNWEKPAIGRLKRLMLEGPGLMRRLGYWRKQQAHGLRYFILNQYTIFGPDGEDKKFSMPRRLIYWFLSIMGKQNKAWKIVEALFGRRWYQNQGLTEISQQYKNITLIQSANWGLQDRSLARLSKEQSWRSVFIPYTNDQLYVNGFLINDYDAICVQGDFEYQCAQIYHEIPKEKIFPLGSPWFRHLLELIDEEKLTHNIDLNKPKIVYAGISNVYFPMKSEFKALDALVEYVSRPEINLFIIYRPVVFDNKIREKIKCRYGNLRNLKIDWPEVNFIGLYGYSDKSQKKSLQNYVRSLQGCKLLVMSHMTSLSLDAAFLENCGVISNMIDTDGILEKRFNYLFPSHFLPGMRIVNSVEDLISNVDEILKSPDQTRKEAAKFISLWDYPYADFSEILNRAVFGPQDLK